MELRCEVTRVEDLGEEERRRWERIRRSSPALASPFFAYDFAAAVAAARRDVRVAVLRAPDGALAGFFPYQASGPRAARPVGGRLSDYHGVVIADDADWEVPALLRGCGLRSFTFDHLIAAQAPFAPHFRTREVSPVVDFPAGGPRWPREAALKRRRLGRRGSLAFRFHEEDPAALRTLIGWKSAQYRRTGVFDAFSRPWVVEVVERIHARRSERLQGVLSTLHAGEELVAVHFGMRSGPVLHSWMPAYSTAAARDSPGIVLMQMLLEAAPRHGIAALDFGKGPEPYKQRFANAAVEVGAGAVRLGRARTAAATLSETAWSAALHSPLYARVHRLRQRSALR